MEITFYVLISAVAAIVISGMFLTFLSYKDKKRNQPKKPVTWYWDKRMDFTGKTYYFPKYKENHSCKCNHFKHERHDISGQD